MGIASGSLCPWGHSGSRSSQARWQFCNGLWIVMATKNIVHNRWLAITILQSANTLFAKSGTYDEVLF